MKKSVELKNGNCILECNESDVNVCCNRKDYNSCHFVSRDRRGVMYALIFSLLFYMILLLGIIKEIHEHFN